MTADPSDKKIVEEVKETVRHETHEAAKKGVADAKKEVAAEEEIKK